MRRIFTLFILGIITFTLLSCEGKKEAKMESKLSPTANKNISVAMVSDIGGIDDRSFNQNAWEGIMKFVEENGTPIENYTYASSHIPDEFIANLSNFADQGKSLIVTPGYYFKYPIDKVAPKYPKQKFLLIDAISSDSKNVLSITYATEQSSFLAGICTALKAKQMGLKKVGFLGGVDGYIVQSFEAGYIAGIKEIDPSIKVVVEYADDFANPTKGQKIGSEMFDKGIKIIFGVAGATGNGLIKEAKKRAKKGENVWVIGVDKDQYGDGIYADGKSVILTSSVKKLDVAAYDALNSVKDNTFSSGHMVYSLDNDGVGLPKTNPNLKDEWIKIIKRYKKDIISGKIEVPVKPKRVL